MKQGTRKSRKIIKKNLRKKPTSFGSYAWKTSSAIRDANENLRPSTFYTSRWTFPYVCVRTWISWIPRNRDPFATFAPYVRSYRRRIPSSICDRRYASISPSRDEKRKLLSVIKNVHAPNLTSLSSSNDAFADARHLAAADSATT